MRQLRPDYAAVLYPPQLVGLPCHYLALSAMNSMHHNVQDGVDMTLMGHDIKASDLFVAALENEGVTHIFALPGRVSPRGFPSYIQPLLCCIAYMCPRSESSCPDAH